MKFSSYNLRKDLLSALQELNYIEMTPVQEKVIKRALKNESLIVKAETGSGKTHAYLVPLINNLSIDHAVQGIILEPTLELVRQTGEFLEKIKSKNPIFQTLILTKSAAIIDEKKLSKPTIIVATPGKIIELSKLGIISLKENHVLVLDEADMLFENAAREEMEDILKTIHYSQLLVFTATMKEHEIASLKKYLKINTFIEVNKNYVSNMVKHHFVNIKHRNKIEALKLFLKTVNPYFALVFTKTVKESADIYYKLNQDNIKCALISSSQSERERKNLLKRILDGEYNLIICSDVASRGLDLPFLSDVISLDIPSNVDYYYHRAGRTGRNNNQGNSYIFYDDDLNQKDKKDLESKLQFDYLILRDDGVKTDKKHTPMKKRRNAELEKDIKKAVAKVRSYKVKPNYKKKMRLAAEKAEKKHKRNIIIKNLKSKKKAQASVK